MKAAVHTQKKGEPEGFVHHTPDCEYGRLRETNGPQARAAVNHSVPLATPVQHQLFNQDLQQARTKSHSLSTRVCESIELNLTIHLKKYIDQYGLPKHIFNMVNIRNKLFEYKYL